MAGDSDWINKDVPTEELLEMIRMRAMMGCVDKNLNEVVLPFAALLVKLSKEASATADKNLLIQKRMILLTVFILFVSLAQLGSIFINKSQCLPSVPEAKNTTTKPENIKQNSNPVHR